MAAPREEKEQEIEQNPAPGKTSEEAPEKSPNVVVREERVVLRCGQEGRKVFSKNLLLSTTALNLSHNKLTRLPPEIGRLINLTELNLSFNKLTTLPPEIGRLINLTTLNLSRNQLTTLPPEICRLINLKKLHLYGNKLTTLPPEICRLINLTTLNLSGNQLTTFPLEIGHLINLKTLHLYFNKLATLPPEIGHLINMTTLYLSRNQLTTLPPEIGRLINLKKLHLSGNKLTTLPPEIGRLINLKKLNLYFNQLTTLPPEIGRLINLKKLNLSGNKLTTLPPEIGRLKLITLDLSGNKLTTLPPEIGRLINLTTLNLWGNQLTMFPPEIGRLINLTALNLSFNKLTTLPPEIGRLINLTTLNLSFNKLTTLPPEIGRLFKLKTLNLSGNKLTTLPPEIGRLINLTELNLNFNQLPTLPPEIGRLINLKKLHLSKNPFADPFLHELASRKDRESLPENVAKAVFLLSGVVQHEKIGEGSFGQVFRGSWNNAPVALKTLRDSSIDEFISEVSALKELDHLNVLRFFGVAELSEKDDFSKRYLVMELANGTVLDLIRNEVLSVEVLFTIALSCAAGMAYLCKRRIVHRDLAARNLLFTRQGDGIAVKVADFGLARFCASRNLLSLFKRNPCMLRQARKSQTGLTPTRVQMSQDDPCPINWTAPEGLRDGVFSPKSDVWSFGVVLWELFSKGAVPFGHERLSREEMLAKLDAGERLEPPPSCGAQLAAIMKSCWHSEPEQRPSFKSLIKSLRRCCPSAVQLDSFQTPSAASACSQFSVSSFSIAPPAPSAPQDESSPAPAPVPGYGQQIDAQ